MAIHTHPNDTFPVYHQINTKSIYKISQLVLQTSGMAIQPHKAIVGANAFAHESGIHQDGVLKHPSTYEIIDPAEVGVPSNAIVLGKSSGRNALRAKLAELGIQLSSADALQRLFSRFKALADKKTKVTDHDLVALAEDQLISTESGERFYLKHLTLISGTDTVNTATATIIDTHATPLAKSGSESSPASSVNGEDEDNSGSSSNEPIKGQSIVDAAIGHGPIQAVFAVLLRITKCTDLELRHYEVRSVSSGEDALAKVFVKVARVNSDNADGSGDDATQVYSGQGADNDTIHASAKACLNAINRYLVSQQ
jgi:2-isopropylmalate synthase